MRVAERLRPRLRIGAASALRQRIAAGEAAPRRIEQCERMVREFRRKDVNGRPSEQTARQFGIASDELARVRSRSAPKPNSPPPRFFRRCYFTRCDVNRKLKRSKIYLEEILNRPYIRGLSIFWQVAHEEDCRTSVDHIILITTRIKTPCSSNHSI